MEVGHFKDELFYTAALYLMSLAAVFSLQAGHEPKTFIVFEK